MIVTGSVLSGSTDGKPIPVVQTGSPGTTIHTAGAQGFDEVYLFASNISDADVVLFIEWGGTTDPGDHLIHSMALPANSAPYPISAGLRIKNSKVIRAYCSSASAVNITGWVNTVI